MKKGDQVVESARGQGDRSVRLPRGHDARTLLDVIAGELSMDTHADQALEVLRCR